MAVSTVTPSVVRSCGAAQLAIEQAESVEEVVRLLDGPSAVAHRDRRTSPFGGGQRR
jgi:hypothetical protein